MKISVLIMVLVFSLSAFASRVDVDINGMSCGMCEISVTNELKALDKVENITVNVKEKKAHFDEIKGKKISDTEIRTAIKKAGYDVVKINRRN